MYFVKSASISPYNPGPLYFEQRQNSATIIAKPMRAMPETKFPIFQNAEFEPTNTSVVTLLLCISTSPRSVRVRVPTLKKGPLIPARFVDIVVIVVLQQGLLIVSNARRGVIAIDEELNEYAHV